MAATQQEHPSNAAEMSLTQRQHDASYKVNLRFSIIGFNTADKKLPSGPSDTIELDLSTGGLQIGLQDICRTIRDGGSEMQLAYADAGYIMLFTVVLFDRGDSRNVYFRRDDRREFRFRTLRDLFTTAELDDAARTGEILTLRFTIECFCKPVTHREALTHKHDQFIRFWAFTEGLNFRVLPDQIKSDVQRSAVLHIDIPQAGPAKVFIYRGADQGKVEVDQHMAKLYGKYIMPKLTFRSYEPIAGMSATSSYGTVQLSVRLINQLDAADLGRVTLPAHARIELPSPDVATSKIKKAIRSALDQMKGRLDEGKPKGAEGGVCRLFDNGNSKVWDIELWVMPQGHDINNFHRYEASTLKDFCNNSWKGYGLYVEAHLVPVGYRYTPQEGLPKTESAAVDDAEATSSQDQESVWRVPDNAHTPVSEQSDDTAGNLITTYGYGKDGTTIETFELQQQLLPSRADWSTRHFEHFLHVDLMPSEDHLHLSDAGPNIYGTRSSILRSIFAKRDVLTDYDNRGNDGSATESHEVNAGSPTGAVRWIGINVINSLHAIGLGNVHIPPILISTKQPVSITTSSIIDHILRTIEQQALQEPEGDLGRLYSNETKMQWLLQLWYLPQGKDSTTMLLPGDTTWDKFFGDEDDTLYVEAHSMPLVVSSSMGSAMSTAELASDTAEDPVPEKEADEDEDPNSVFAQKARQDDEELERAMAAVALLEIFHETDNQKLVSEQRAYAEIFKHAYPSDAEQPTRSLGHMVRFGESDTFAERRPLGEQDRAAKKTIDEALDKEVEEDDT